MNTQKRHRALGIGAKTLISHMVLALFVILLAGSLSFFLITRFVRQTRMNELLSKAEVIAHLYPRGVEEDVMPRRPTVRMYEALTDARVFYLNVDTERIRMSSYPLDSADNAADELQWVEVIDTIDHDMAARILDGASVTDMRRYSFMQDDILLAGVPIADADGALLGGVILAQPISELNSLSRGMYLVVVLAAGGSMLLAMLLALEQSRMLVRPIQRITRAARRMAEGTYAERIRSLPNNEIGDLGRALNSMSARLVEVISSLRKERDKLEWVISGIQEGLVAVDAQWNLVHVNQSFLEMLELDRAADINDNESESFYTFHDMLGKCLTSGERQRLEWTNPSGRALRADASAIKDESGAVLGTVCMVRDVSEAQRMEQLRRDYVANISHELRTPLTGIRGMVEPLIDGCMETEAERQESYQIILKETIRLEKLVGEMLDMSRLQDGRVTVELEPMELTGIVEAAARTMRPIADEAQVHLSVETDGSTLSCMGNEDRITQVLVILLDNALSFTPPGGTVTLFASEQPDWIAVGVRDTGCGIEPKDLPNIWERFYKADKSRMRTKGTGLGLSIARLVVQMMGGTIDVQSEPGKGAEFTFTLRKAA